MKIGVACDHAGYSRKMEIINYLTDLGYEIEDFGCNSEDSCDYPDYIHPLAAKVDSKELELGVIICGSANGVSMTANKYQGVRSAICWMVDIAKLSREHNNANICAIPARFISAELSFEIVKTFVDTEFEGGRHELRVNKIAIKK